ncbi:hypothetical protein P378_02780 [Desulforamulus profundi]|uniref:GGDEF domain-containing protein n=1 Tax=Desulforamulus profundi TaxID=1383067 RepID=A0A2C6MB88_9FIRM|nr:hypothetical protein P378_02780 [Desulforamulus profundi]
MGVYEELKPRRLLGGAELFSPLTTCAGTINITASLGVSQRRPEDTAESLIQRADGYLTKLNKKAEAG